MDYRSLRYTDEKSDKFWSIALTRCSHTVNYGRYATDGQTQTKEFPTEDAARKSYDKLIAEKLKKGYVDDREAIIVPIGFCEGRGYANVNAPSIAVSTTPPTSVASEPATNLPDNLPINWRELAFQEIQASLVQNKKQLCELAAIDAIPSAYVFQLDVDYRIEISKSSATHPNLLIQLSDDDRFEVRKGLASNPNLPIVIMEKLAQDSNVEVRIALSKNIKTHYTALAILADDLYQKVRRNVAFHKNTPGDTIIEKSLQELSEYDRRQAKERASRSFQSSPATLEKLAEDDNSSIHQGLASNPNTPLHVLERILRKYGQESYIARAIFINPVIHNSWFSKYKHVSRSILSQYPDMIPRLAEHSDPRNRLTILKLVLVLEETLKVVIRNLDSNYKKYYRESCYLIIQHQNISLSILDELAQKIFVDAVELPDNIKFELKENIRAQLIKSIELVKNNSVDLILKQTICKHAEGLDFLLPLFLDKPKSLIYFFILHHSHFTDVQLRVLCSTAMNWFDRYAIAQNPSTPKDTLEKLAEDEHLFVRAAARSALGLEVICSPAVETVAAIAIEEPQVITTNPVVEAVPIEFKVERSIDLNPEDWLWVAGRSRKSKSPSEPKPFDLQDALNRLKQIEGETPDRQRKLVGYFSLDWNNAEIAPNLSLEEANFWLTAMTCDLPIIGGRPSGYWNKQNLEVLAELLEGMCFKYLPDFRQIISMLLQDWRAIHSPILRPLNNLFSIIEIIIDIYQFHQSDDLSALRYIESVFDRDYLEKYAADRPAYSPEQVIQSMAIVLRNEARSLLDRLVQGFKSFIHPHLTDEEIRVMQEQLRPVLNIQTNAFHLYKLAAYLGMDEEVRSQIATWQLNQPTAHFVKTATGHLQSQEAIEIIFGLGNPEEIETNVRSLTIPISKPEHLRGWFANMGFTALDLVCKSINTDEQLAVFTLAKAPEVAPYMLELWLSLKKPQLARQWLEDYPIYRTHLRSFRRSHRINKFK